MCEEEQQKTSKSANRQGPPGAVCSDELRDDRLRRIKRDVRNGKYEGGEFLSQALEIMLKQLSDDTE